MHATEYHHHISKLIHLKDKLGLLYLHLVIQAFAISLVSIFVPIYLLTIGFTLSEVFIYLFIEWTLFGLFAPLYGKVIHKIGLKGVILFRTPFYILGLILLFLLDTNIQLRTFYLIIPIILGSSGALYTLSITSLFAKYIGKSDHSVKTAKLLSYPKMFAIASPTIGAFIAAIMGFPFLLSLVAVLLFLSVIPIFLIKERISHPKFNLNIFREIKLEFREFIFLNSYGLKGLIFFLILPISIYLYSENIMSLGIIVTSISLISAIFTIYLGKLANRHGLIKIIKIGAIATFILLISIGYFIKNDIIYYLSFVSGFINIMINLPYETHLYERSREHKSPLEFLVFKEFSLFFGRIVIFSILIIFFLNIEIAYYVGALFSLVFLFF